MNPLKFTLSIDETAMLFSLLSMPEISAKILTEAYGELSEESIEEKLQTASHSLLARGFFTVINGKLAVDASVHGLFDPIRNFKKIIQILSNNLPLDNLFLYTVYFSVDKFTSMKLINGFVYEFESGDIAEFLGFFIDRVCRGEILEKQKDKTDLGIELDKNSLVEMANTDLDGVVSKMIALGFSDDLIEAFSVNISVPVKITNLMLTASSCGPSDDDSAPENIGTGFMIIDGPEESLMFSYNGKTQDRGKLSFLTESKLRSKLASILDQIE